MLKTSGYHNYGIWIIIAFSVGLSIYSSWCGLGLTYDSFDYLAASESFKENLKLTNRNGSPYIFHAPLFPVLLSFFGAYPNNFFPLFNTVICIVTLLQLFKLLKGYFRNKFLFLIGYASISLSVGFQMIHNFLWTEPIFLLLFVFHNHFLLRFLKSEKRVNYWLLICMAFLMGLTKNTGFFIILSTSGILLFYSKTSIFKSSVIYILSGSIGFVLWNVFVLIFYNGEQMFQNNEFLIGVDVNFINYTDTISRWFLPGFIPYLYRMLFLITVIVIYFLMLKKEKVPIQIKIFLIQFLAYLLIMIVVIRVDKDEIERLLSIVGPWLFIALIMTLELRWKNIGFALRRWILVLLTVWVCYIGFRSINNSIGWHNGNCTIKKSR